MATGRYHSFAFAWLLAGISMTGSCVTVAQISATNTRRPVSYTDLPFKTIKVFSRNETLHYSFGRLTSSSQTLENILDEELKKTPGARGIKNLTVRAHSSGWTSFQFLNGFGYMYQVATTLFYAAEKSIYVSGEIY